MFEQMFDQKQAEQLIDTYLIPWAINIALALVIFVVGRMVVTVITGIIGKLLKKAKYDDMLISFIQAISHAALMLFVVVAALNELGLDTTSLVALLGAAGLAIGLSLQGSLQNFAAGVMLLVFRPFKAGDYVEAGGTAGIVEGISIFNTQIRTPDNKEVIVPNGKIYGENIINYSAKPTRRVDMVFGISYGDDLRKAKEILEKVVAEDERVLPEPKPIIAVSELANSSVNFVVRPWVNSADYWPFFWHMQETVKLRFDEAGITIPFPQMEVHVNQNQSDEEAYKE
ncbi:mechanosensitive ion channel family protein [Neptunicella marina]|uniref:Small-conductance mechanosensitive channel n=1 Tax=Neptunicella marina TaxID=2125989 RepID=A0A8J6IXV3_9ALTE|nr:mechanosensitive ion channel domain-containing protein [Neptunicella marina]MBC3767430.1 mechanosensitive ion channel [Neptunicella marina]